MLREHFKIPVLKIDTSAPKVTHACLNYFRSAFEIVLTILQVTLIFHYTLGVDWPTHLSSFNCGRIQRFLGYKNLSPRVVEIKLKLLFIIYAWGYKLKKKV